MGYNLNNDIPLGQLGSGYLHDAGAFTPPTGKVVVAITMLHDTSLTLLTQEVPTDATYKGPTTSAGVAEVGYFGTTANVAAANGTNSDAIGTSDVFPKGVTIYGRWIKFIPAAPGAGEGGCICYFGY